MLLVLCVHKVSECHSKMVDTPSEMYPLSFNKVRTSHHRGTVKAQIGPVGGPQRLRASSCKQMLYHTKRQTNLLQRGPWYRNIFVLFKIVSNMFTHHVLLDLSSRYLKATESKCCFYVCANDGTCFTFRALSFPCLHRG